MMGGLLVCPTGPAPGLLTLLPPASELDPLTGSMEVKSDEMAVVCGGQAGEQCSR
jgi:hypothetical protein